MDSLRVARVPSCASGVFSSSSPPPTAPSTTTSVAFSPPLKAVGSSAPSPSARRSSALSESSEELRTAITRKAELVRSPLSVPLTPNGLCLSRLSAPHTWRRPAAGPDDGRSPAAANHFPPGVGPGPGRSLRGLHDLSSSFVGQPHFWCTTDTLSLNGSLRPRHEGPKADRCGTLPARLRADAQQVQQL